jgi:hypothetical protein
VQKGSYKLTIRRKTLSQKVSRQPSAGGGPGLGIQRLNDMMLLSSWCCMFRLEPKLSSHCWLLQEDARDLVVCPMSGPVRRKCKDEVVSLLIVDPEVNAKVR